MCTGCNTAFIVHMLVIPVPKQVTGGFASEFNQEELALVAATYSSV